MTPHETRDGDVRVIRFVIDEGPRVIVESVTFTGNHAVPAERLAEADRDEPPGLFRRGLFRLDVLEHDVGVVLAYLRSLGYAEAAVGPPEVHFSDDRTRARVVIPVSEGPRLTVGAVTVEGAHVVTPGEIDAALPFKPGAPWEARQPEDGQRAIERLYATAATTAPSCASRRAGATRPWTSATTSTRASRRASGASSCAASCSRARAWCGGPCPSSRATC